MLCWAVFTIAHAWVKTEGMLIAFRLMIGLFEAGFYPTACFYLSTFYTRYDLAIRIGLFYGMYAVAGAFSAAIAYGIFHIKGPLYGWQYLFIIGKIDLCYRLMSRGFSYRIHLFGLSVLASSRTK
jgi:MFS family permease